MYVIQEGETPPVLSLPSVGNNLVVKVHCGCGTAKGRTTSSRQVQTRECLCSPEFMTSSPKWA